MRYKPRSIGALQVALGGLPDAMRVEAEKGLGVSAKTVGELRKVAAWPENLVITTPQDRYPESAIKVSKASVATRVTPKP
jgi:hypothetical protein